MSVKDFRELRVYQSSLDGAARIYSRSRSWPPDERYSLISQIRRSSRSVCANIAEAWGKRSYPAVFAGKLADALGEAGETITWLQIAVDCGLLDREASAILITQYDGIRAQITVMIKARQRWCRPL